jgi:hypothetical protein
MAGGDVDRAPRGGRQPRASGGPRPRAWRRAADAVGRPRNAPRRGVEFCGGAP